MAIDAIIAKLLRASREARHAGPIGAWRMLQARLAPGVRAEQRRKRDDDRRFDSAGYETATVEMLDGMAIAGQSLAHGRHYDPTPSYDFAATMAALDIDPDGFTFVDLGSGKGRVVMLAAELPFSRIIGVEFAQELHEVAQANLCRRGATRGPDGRIALLHADAADFAMPAGPLILFLFNPFGPPVLDAVALNAFASWRGQPRPVRVIYINPQHPEAWTKAGFRQIAVAPNFRFAIYAPPE